MGNQKSPTARLLKHLALIILMFVLMMLGVFYVYLPYVTHHGESLTVPALEGISLEALEAYLAERNLRYKVEPDSGFSSEYPPLTVLKQFPPPNAKVKEDRKIYVTINSTMPPNVLVPQFVSRSLKDAQLQLARLGLKLGKIEYTPDFAQNTIRGQFYKGRAIEPGAKIPKGEKIDFEVGDGLGKPFPMLNLHEMELDDALVNITGNGLTLGQVFYSPVEYVSPSSPADSLQERWSNERLTTLPRHVFKQSPLSGEIVQVGMKVDLWVVEEDTATTNQPQTDF